MPSLPNDNFDLPLAKRQKRVSKGNNVGQRGSKIFAPFRVSRGIIDSFL
jgi:U3 small nucleolar RNA-associated protein 21